MSIELLLKDFDRLEALAKKADESLHIGKTAIQKDYAVAKMLDENIGAVTDISHDLGLYSATEEKVVVKFSYVSLYSDFFCSFFKFFRQM